MDKKVYAVCEEWCSSEDEFEAWTISENPDRTGWETDSGHHGYGLSKEKAEHYVKCINMYPRLVRVLEELHKYFDFEHTSDEPCQVWSFDLPHGVNEAMKEVYDLLKIVRGDR